MAVKARDAGAQSRSYDRVEAHRVRVQAVLACCIVININNNIVVIIITITIRIIIIIIIITIRILIYNPSSCRTHKYCMQKSNVLYTWLISNWVLFYLGSFLMGPLSNCIPS